MVGMLGGALVVLVACSTSTPPSPSSSGGSAAPDASTAMLEAGACANPVSGRCANEGATACGHPAMCTDVGEPGDVTCTCRNGIWDCRKCGDCSPGMAACGNTQACQGGSALRCDGVTVKVVQCKCGFGVTSGPWECTDFDGNTFATGCGDAGADAH